MRLTQYFKEIGSKLIKPTLNLWLLLVWWIRFLRICDAIFFFSSRHDWLTKLTRYDQVRLWNSTELILKLNSVDPVLLRSSVTFPILFFHKLRHWVEDPQSVTHVFAECWSVKDRFYLGLSKIKIPWKIVNNGTKQYVIFNYQYFLIVILYENRQYITELDLGSL